jgi:hypothetical protein
LCEIIAFAMEIRLARNWPDGDPFGTAEAALSATEDYAEEAQA